MQTNSRHIALITLFCAAILIVVSLFNVSLWQNGGTPRNELSRIVIGIQVFSALPLLILVPLNLISSLLHLARKKFRDAGFCFVASLIALGALVFTMAYDQGSVFHQ